MKSIDVNKRAEQRVNQWMNIAVKRELTFEENIIIARLQSIANIAQLSIDGYVITDVTKEGRLVIQPKNVWSEFKPDDFWDTTTFEDYKKYVQGNFVDEG